MSVQIRTALAADASEIARLSAELGYPTPTADISSRLAVLLSLPNHFVAVAIDGANLLGWVAVEHRLILECGDKAELVGLVVDARARRTGLGQALVSAAECWAIAQGLAAITVRSNIVRPAAHQFYKSIGYAHQKTQHVYTKRLSID